MFALDYIVISEDKEDCMIDQGQCGAGGGIDCQAQMAQSVASIAESLKVIAESSKATAAVFKKIDERGLPPSFLDMTEAWRLRWSVA